MHGEEGADLHFDLDGGPFHWWKFNLQRISGHLHWAGEHLNLTNVQADFYGGAAAGYASFDFTPREPAEFRFVVLVTNALLHPFMMDLAGRTNRLEGQFSGMLGVSRGNTANWHSVFGQGNLSLHDGLIWDIPIFGIFSPVLNGIAPGLGNSRATAATSTFLITNGVVRTEDMEIRSTGMRLKYRGSVDLEGALNARVEAEMLRDMWVVGPILSTVLWPVTKLFEYKVSGTIGDPKSEPVFLIPKLILFPFHPIRTLKGAEEPDSSQFTPLPPQ
jgi:hypothetical protein